MSVKRWTVIRLLRLGGASKGVVRWLLDHRLRIGATVVGVGVLVGIAAGVVSVVEFVWRSDGSARTELEIVTATLSVVNETTSEARVSNWFRYHFVEYYSLSGVVEWPEVTSRARLPDSEEPLDSDIALKPGDHVDLLLDIRVDRSASALLDRASGDLFVIGHLANGKPVVNAMPFQRDTLHDFYLELRIEEE